MGKKKKSKKKGNDLRGYSTTSVARAPPITTTNAKTQPTTAKDEVTAINKVVDPIKVSEPIIGTSPKEESGDPVSSEPRVVEDAYSSKRFFNKIENLHDRLLGCKFTFDQVKWVLQELASSSSNNNNNNDTSEGGYDPFSLEAALDWFCLHLPTEELPPLFTEESEREAIENATKTVEIVKPTGSASHQPIKFDPSTDVLSMATSTPPKDDEVEAVATKLTTTESNQQKDWILSQYQYEDEEEIDEVQEQANSFTKDQNNEAANDGVVEELSPEEVRYAKLEGDIAELSASLEDEASNYMRSKHEVKDLQKQLSNLRSAAKKLRGKIEKIKAERRRQQQQERRDEEGEGGMEEIEEDGTGAALFGMFDNSSAETAKPTNVEETVQQEKEGVEGLTDPFKLHSSESSIPKDWTGQTPKTVLHDWCKKRKVPPPTYSKLPRSVHGCRLRVKAKPPLELDQAGPFYDYKDAQNFVAAQGLYMLEPDMPIYRLLPPVFRDLWKGWIERRENEANRAKSAERKEKVAQIQELINLISSRLVFKDEPQVTVDHDHDVSTLPTDTPDSWDDDDSQNGIQTPAIANEEKRLEAEGAKLREEFDLRRKTPEYVAMAKIRESLPMYSYKEELLRTIKENTVTILFAETGAGKTTQCPQYILEDCLATNVASTTSIICTQPRRISAISVAERVADETCTTTGDLVGYQIRNESRRSKETRLLFCTTGVILRRLQDDPNLEGVTHVIVDEVHERQWQIDFLLIALRAIVQKSRRDLKVVLMSATLDAELFCSFFGNAPLVSVPGRSFPVANYHLEDLLDATDHIIEEDSVYALRGFGQSREKQAMHITTRGGEKRREMVDLHSQTDVSEVSGLYQGYKMSTQRSMDRVDEIAINYELIEDILTLLFENPERNATILPPATDDGQNKFPVGAVLVFLPGMGEIRTLTSRLSGSRVFGDRKRYDIIPMHSTLSPQDQKRAFSRPKPGCRKLILSTNICETSVTIPDVVCVIDSGLVREVRQDKRYATSRLILDWCSRASAKQRAGRAGRVQPGICCKLYSSNTAEKVMRAQTMPELQRVPLEEVCLSILGGKLSNSCATFLQQAPQPPSDGAVRLALNLLSEVGAIEATLETQQLTPLGEHLAKIPVHVRLGKMLIFGCIFKCLDPILTIVSGLSCKSPFVASAYSGADASAFHAKFKDAESDFLTITNLWKSFKLSLRDSRDRGRGFCRKNFLSWSAMVEIGDMRRQCLDLLSQIGFVQRRLNEESVASSVYNKNALDDRLVHSVLCAGLYGNVAHAVKEHPNDPPSLWHKQERLLFHSSSVNHKKRNLPSDWVLFHAKFATARTTVSATSPIHQSALMMFGGQMVIKHLDHKVIIDDWIELPVAAQKGVMLKELRGRLKVLLQKLVESVDLTQDVELVEAVVKVLQQN